MSPPMPARYTRGLQASVAVQRGIIPALEYLTLGYLLDQAAEQDNTSGSSLIAS